MSFLSKLVLFISFNFSSIYAHLYICLIILFPIKIALHGQQDLLLFGFQSTYVKLKELCEPNAKLLDGRSDLHSRNDMFETPKSRYKVGGADTEVVLQIKKESIKTFNEVGDLCTRSMFTFI